MKRIITFMMALALVLSLSVTAFAEGDGSITITNATVGINYKLYKIFDATYVDGGTDANGNHIVDTVAYSLKTDSPVYTYMFTGEGVVEDTDAHTLSNGVFTYNTVTGAITKVDGADADAITAYLTDMVRTLYSAEEATNDDCFVANQTADAQEVAFNGLGYGYYLIDTAKATDTDADKAKIAVTITTNTPSIEVIEKNQLPGGDIEKKTDKETANVGDIIHWEVKFTATNYDGEEKVLSYTIKDTLTPENWAAIDLDSIEITVGGKKLEDDAWELKEETSTSNGFEIEIPWVNNDDDQTFKYDATAEVVVTYTATVLDAAATINPAQDALKNTATVEWGSDTIHQDETETEVYNMGFTKVDGTDATKTLAGAIFELYSDSECKNPVYVKTTTTEGVYILDASNATEKTNTVTTPANGQVVIMGLDEGTYYLKETKAPEGYNKLDDVKDVEVKKGAADTLTFGEGDSAVTYKLNNAKLTIENNSGVELPSTGGVGTMMMISFGTMVAIAFAILMITQKKMSVYRD